MPAASLAMSFAECPPLLFFLLTPCTPEGKPLQCQKTKGPKGSRLPGLTRQGGKHTLQRPKTKGQCARRRAGPRHGDHPGPGRPPFWRTVVGRPRKGLYRGALKINTRHTPRAERERERDQERERALLLY